MQKIAVMRTVIMSIVAFLVTLSHPAFADGWIEVPDSSDAKLTDQPRDFLRRCPSTDQYLPGEVLTDGVRGSRWLAQIERSGRIVSLKTVKSTGSARLDFEMMRLARDCTYDVPADATDQELQRVISIQNLTP